MATANQYSKRYGIRSGNLRHFRIGFDLLIYFLVQLLRVRYMSTQSVVRQVLNTFLHCIPSISKPKRKTQTVGAPQMMSAEENFFSRIRESQNSSRASCRSRYSRRAAQGGSCHKSTTYPPSVSFDNPYFSHSSRGGLRLFRWALFDLCLCTCKREFRVGAQGVPFLRLVAIRYQ